MQTLARPHRRRVPGFELLMALVCTTVVACGGSPAAEEATAAPGDAMPNGQATSSSDTEAGDAVGEGRPAAADGAVEAIVDLTGWRVASAQSGKFELAWRADGDTIPRNRDFGMDVQLLRDGRPWQGPRLVVRGWMPDHAHGLVRGPLVSDEGDGRFRVDAMLLHMRGRWQLLFDVTDVGMVETVSFEVTL